MRPLRQLHRRRRRSHPRPSRRARSIPTTPPSPPGGAAPHPLTEADDLLYEALRQRRLQLAREEAVSAFIIASNRELAALAQARPASLSELANVKGFGRKKIQRYGEALLQVIAESTQHESPRRP